jgi:hypothetical protein
MTDHFSPSFTLSLLQILMSPILTLIRSVTMRKLLTEVKQCIQSHQSRQSQSQTCLTSKA